MIQLHFHYGENWSYFPIVVDLYLLLCRIQGNEKQLPATGFWYSRKEEIHARLHSSGKHKDIISIAKRAFNLVNPRLMGRPPWGGLPISCSR